MSKYRFVKSVIRSLKRQYGQSVILYKTTTTATIDWTTGTSSGRLTSTKTIAKALVLPGRTSRNFNYDLAIISANKGFTGGQYDPTQRDVIIDRDDVGTFNINMNTRVRFDSSDYAIKELHDYEEQNAVYLTVVKVEGQTNES